MIAGMALFDTMNHIKSKVVTINLGLAASMASFLLAGGEKGSRMALPNSRVMIHQPMGGAQGQAEDIKVGDGWWVRQGEISSPLASHESTYVLTYPRTCSTDRSTERLNIFFLQA